MAISLSKGQKIDLTKTNPGLTKIQVGLGWDVVRYDGSSDFDLDASVFLLNNSGKVRNESDFVYYGNLIHNSKSVEHTGDNRTGQGDGDDEVIKVDLPTVPAEIEKIAFTVTIYDAANRKQNFGQIENAYVRVLNAETQQELIRYDLGEDFSVETALVICELYRHNGEWKFSAIGSGFEGGLSALCQNYGIDAKSE